MGVMANGMVPCQMWSWEAMMMSAALQEQQQMMYNTSLPMYHPEYAGHGDYMAQRNMHNMHTMHTPQLYDPRGVVRTPRQLWTPDMASRPQRDREDVRAPGPQAKRITKVPPRLQQRIPTPATRPAACDEGKSKGEGGPQLRLLQRGEEMPHCLETDTSHVAAS
mmetsp:Transcript_67834/g.159658  ORF Transcript_67834/g.159658 Transcript_67834/m.159658 type:complete len:164 (+) Transcript_67834:2-493(+)